MAPKMKIEVITNLLIVCPNCMAISNCDRLMLGTFVIAVLPTSSHWVFWSMPSSISRRWWQRRRSCLVTAKQTTKLWKQCKVVSLVTKKARYDIVSYHVCLQGGYSLDSEVCNQVW